MDLEGQETHAYPIPLCPALDQTGYELGLDNNLKWGRYLVSS